MFKIIDGYIIKKFISTYLFIIIIFLAIGIIFDFVERLDDFIKHEAPNDKIFKDYYLIGFIPWLINLLTAFFTFLAFIYFTSRMAANTEIIAILSSGVSYYRLMFPYFISALIIVLFSLFLNFFILPYSNQVRFDFIAKYVDPYRNTDDNIHRQIAPGIYMFMSRYDTYENMGSDFSLEKFEDGKLVSKLMADRITWDSTKQVWTAFRYRIRTINGIKETLETGRKMDTTLTIHPNDFNLRETFITALNFKELNQLIAKKEMEGASNINYYYIEKYKRMTTPYSIFILTIIGVSVASRKMRGGIGLNIAIGLGLSCAYILFDKIFVNVSLETNMNPLLAVWIPNIFFTLIGALMLMRAAR